MRKILSCELNLDTACVELCPRGRDAALHRLHRRGELRWQTVCTSGSELDWLIYNAPLEYVNLILNGEPDRYFESNY